MRRILLLIITLLLTMPLLFLRSAQMQEPKKPLPEQPLPNTSDYQQAGARCKRRHKLAPWVGTPEVGTTGKYQCVLDIHTCDGKMKTISVSGVRDSGADMCKDFWDKHSELGKLEICCDDSSTEKKTPYCGDCKISQGNNCVVDKTRDGKACDNGGHCGSCNNGTCEPVKMEASRPSLVQTKSMGIPRPKPDVSPAFTYEAKTVTGSNAATYSTSDPNANPNTGDLKAPANPSATGAPSPGGLAELSVSYTCKGGETVTKKFQAATFGLSCYIISDEKDYISPTPPPTPTPSPTPTPTPSSSPTPTPSPMPPASPTPTPSPTLNCESLRYGTTRYSGVTANPTGLPPGDYCTAFLRDVQEQGSGISRNGTKVKHVSGASPSTWVFKVVSEFTGADNTAVIPFGSVARDRRIIGGRSSINVTLESGTFVANDIGQAIRGYRLDIFGGTGKAACRGFKNRIEVGACDPGSATCPELKSPIP